ncbi:MAG: metallophosphoesterase family protein [Lachnospiraceae bacterium]|nr:metallophosphoesterase family protein [Clostridiales bacterium]MBR6848803.1 metallophosphoesterase family protein [Lachnospiraceae bacterium]
MSRIVFLGDLHGNYTATQAMEACLKKIGPDQIWFLGDAVGKGPSNVETCDWVREHCDHFLKGNWDEWIYDCHKDRNNPDQNPYAKDNLFFADQLGEERLNWLHSLPLEAEILISGLRIRLFHGRPVDQLYQGYDPDETMKQGFYRSDKQMKYDSYICADSHRPYVRSLHDGYAVNTGSIGNSIGVPRAHALLVEGDLDSQEISPISFTILSVPYDNKKEAEIALSTEGLPLADSFANEVLTGVYSR